MFAKFVVVAALLVTITQGGFIDKRQNSPTTHKVKVKIGGPNNMAEFDPSTLSVSKGDIISFAFTGSFQNSVSQSTFIVESSSNTPCQPVATTPSFILNSTTANTTSYTINYTLTDASHPLILFANDSTNPGLCQQGMVLGINLSSNETVDQLRKNAIRSGNTSSSGNDGNTGTKNGAAAHIKLSAFMGLLGITASGMLLL